MNSAARRPAAGELQGSPHSMDGAPSPHGSTVGWKSDGATPDRTSKNQRLGRAQSTAQRRSMSRSHTPGIDHVRSIRNTRIALALGQGGGNKIRADGNIGTKEEERGRRVVNLLSEKPRSAIKALSYSNALGQASAGTKRGQSSTYIGR